MKKEKLYSTWSNFLYTFSHLRQKEGAGAFFICGGNVGMSILLPFLEAALAGAVAACLTSQMTPGIILFCSMGYIFILQTVRLLQGHLQGLIRKTLFIFRISMAEDFYQKILRMDGQCLESTNGQTKRESAQRNLFSGNDLGIEAYAQNYLALAANLGGLILYGIIVGRCSILLLVFLTAQTILSSFFHFLAGKRAYQLEDGLEKTWQELLYLRRESVLPENGKDIRMYRMSRWFLKRFHNGIERITTTIDREQNGFMAAGITQKLLSLARNILIYGYLILKMTHGRLTLPAFLLYIGIVSGFESWVNGLFEAIQQILANEKVMDGYRDFMDYGVLPKEEKPAPNAPGKAHEIQLENVCFRYEGSSHDTIHNLNLTIRAGEKLALVGLNGAGKTTLAKLLCGLYRPTGGKIYLDGQDLQTLSQKEVFKEYSIVFQEVFAFSFPLAANISCSMKKQEREDKLKDSLIQAGLWEKVQNLPKGIFTTLNKDLDEEGVSLSGGELQKLMLARALYKNAPMVILDEPTAALDPLAESEMYEKYDRLTNKKTAIFISHRLSSTRFCDRILFLQKGSVIEEGSHKDLMAKKGAYAELFTLQAKYYQKKRKEEKIYA